MRFLPLPVHHSLQDLSTGFDWSILYSKASQLFKEAVALYMNDSEDCHYCSPCRKKQLLLVAVYLNKMLQKKDNDPDICEFENNAVFDRIYKEKDENTDKNKYNGNIKVKNITEHKTKSKKRYQQEMFQQRRGFLTQPLG